MVWRIGEETAANGFARENDRQPIWESNVVGDTVDVAFVCDAFHDRAGTVGKGDLMGQRKMGIFKPMDGEGSGGGLDVVDAADLDNGQAGRIREEGTVRTAPDDRIFSEVTASFLSEHSYNLPWHIQYAVCCRDDYARSQI
jgi:hypothetical protein